MGTRTAEQFISIHSPRMGRDGGYITFPRVKKNFNPLSPHGERHRPWPGIRPPRPFQSTLPAWGETGEALGEPTLWHISIHSPRMGRDRRAAMRQAKRQYFNPLSPHGERLPNREREHRNSRFQSTLPAWGETLRALQDAARHRHFNPLSPHGERQSPSGSTGGRWWRFQSTLPAWGETKREKLEHLHPGRFQSTLPAWGETSSAASVICWSLFQSTLPAWGETVTGVSFPRYVEDFNPLSPHGERPIRQGRQGDAQRISIHSPRMGRDYYASRGPRRLPISIHSPRMGRDLEGRRLHPAPRFQSTLPAWGETANAHNFSKRKTGASAQHCIFSPAKRFFLLTKNFLEKRNKPFFRCEPYRKTVGAPVSHQPLKN